MTPDQQAQVDARFATLQAIQPYHGVKKALRLGGIVSAVKASRIGSKAFGWHLHGYRGGNAFARHRTGRPAWLPDGRAYRRASDGRWLSPRAD